MNTNPRAAARRRDASRRARSRLPFHSPSTRAGRSAVLAAAGIVVGGLTLGTALAQPAARPIAAIDAGATNAIQLIDRQSLAPGLAEVRIGFATGASPASGANRLLALAPDGATAAIASQVGPGPATLTLARRDGSAVRVTLPGLIGAGFAPDGSWLATIDGSGAMWRVPDSGAALARRADGPFVGTPIVQPDGSVLALRVSSVEAPIVSRLVRISADGGMEVLTADDLVYGAQLIADGSIAFAAHRGSRTYLMRLDGGATRQVADLGEDAVNAALSPDGDAVAFEREGQVFLQAVAGRTATLLGAGARPRFAPNGRSVLVELDSGSALLALDGRRLATFADQTDFAACGEGCQP